MESAKTSCRGKKIMKWFVITRDRPLQNKPYSTTAWIADKASEENIHRKK